MKEHISSMHEEHGGMDHMSHHAHMAHDFKRRFFVVLPLTVIVLLLSSKIQEWLGFNLDFAGREFVLFGLASLIVLWGGLPFYSAGKEELRSRNFGMMTLVSLAVISGYLFSVAATFLFPGESLYWEISTLVLAFLFGHWMEMRAVVGTTGALEELAKLIPPMAHRLVWGPVASSSHPMSSRQLLALDGTPSGRATPREVTDVPTESLVKGDWVLIKPGEKMPADGKVIEGESSVNEAMITGESRPVFKKKGDEVIGGTINNDGSLVVEVTKTGRESAISQIMELIKQAQSSKPSVQRLADRAANALTITAIVVGLATLLFWLFVNPHGAIFAATLAITVVVIACPHALGLAIPTVTTITTALAAKNGILIKDMKALEVARRLNWVIFDKTGTLTTGEFGVEEVLAGPAPGFPPASARHSPARVSGALLPVSPANEILRLAASVDYHSQHSISRAIVNEAKRKKVSFRPAQHFKSHPGRGAEGRVDGKNVVVGNSTMMREIGADTEILEKKIQREIKEGKSFVWVARKQSRSKVAEVLGVIVLADQVRDESREAVEKLHGMGIKVAMLTGDNESIARSVARKLGIDTFFAEVLPGEKVDKVKELQGSDTVVAMVGDGVNDAPALTQAHVGIAIGAGTDVAVEAGQIVLVKNDPRDIVKVIGLSRKTDFKMKQNLAWATGYNVLAIPAAAGVFYSFGVLLRPEWGALLMSASSVIVVFNALLLRNTKLS
ncbi:MAG: heavy metal translocating P-type ATPase [Candidatus Blackburnbacteria bacterium]|nr:heavy metal translocating P-type ATPase [Candidatus Blackburnbacteria bacterium]